MILIPLTGNFSGLTSSTIATVGNVALFDIWSAKEERKKQGSIVQAAHGMYAFGGVLSGKLPSIRGSDWSTNRELIVDN